MPRGRAVRHYLIGRRFGRLTVVALDRASGHRTWVCRCDCGVTKTIRQKALLRGDTQSCGCLRSAVVSLRFRTHGETSIAGPQRRSAEYRTWRAIKTRCLNPRSQDAARYGGRGIMICDAWRESFAAFLADMGRRPSARHSIDRIDNDGPYSPSNCRWATGTEQIANRPDVQQARAFQRWRRDEADLAWA